MVDCGFSMFRAERIRLRGINAPEVRTRNKEEKKIKGIDVVNVKKQEEFRPGGTKSERRKRKYIHNTIAHICKKDVGKYVLNGHGINNVLLFLTAFLFQNGLIDKAVAYLKEIAKDSIKDMATFDKLIEYLINLILS